MKSARAHTRGADMSEAIECDVLVVGLGPAGASAAERAAREGARVIAIERRAIPGHPVQCAEFVPHMIGMEVDLLGQVMRQEIGAMRTFIENNGAYESKGFSGVMIDRAKFDAALVTAAEAAGVQCLFATALRSLDGSGAARLSSGQSVRAAVIIGADGPHSIVGKAVGAVNEEIAETRQIQVALLRPFAATDIFLSASMPGGYAWLFPKHGVANVGLGVAPAWRQRLKPLLETIHRRLVDEGRVGADILGTTGGSLPVGGMRRLIARVGATDILLVGDAAGLTNPVTGAGIAAAVMSGRLAGTAAAARAKGFQRAATEYAEEVESLLGASLARALNRRRCLMAIHEAGREPEVADFQASWIAFPDYWARREVRGIS